MGRDEYPVMTTLSLGIFIRIESGIFGNQQYSAYDNRGGRVGCQKKGRTGHTFAHRLQGGTQGVA